MSSSEHVMTTFRYRARKTHADLGEGFFDPVRPADFPQPILRYRNDRAAATVGLDALTDEEWIAHFGRFEPLPGNLDPAAGACATTATSSASTTPTSATAAASSSPSCARPATRPPARPRHQGLGPDALVARRRRAADAEGRRARGAGDRACWRRWACRPRDRSRLIETGEELERGDEPSPTRSAVLVRLSHSHVRFGTFQRHAYLRGRGPDRGPGRPRDRAYYPELGEGANDRAAAPARRGRGRAARLTGAAGWPPASSTACSTPTT